MLSNSYHLVMDNLHLKLKCRVLGYLYVLILLKQKDTRNSKIVSQKFQRIFTRFEASVGPTFGITEVIHKWRDVVLLSSNHRMEPHQDWCQRQVISAFQWDSWAGSV